LVCNEHGIEVFATAENLQSPAPAGLLRSSFIIPADLMNNGTYRVGLIVFQNGVGANRCAEWDDLLSFEVHDAASELRAHYHGDWPGVVRPHLEWKTELLDSLPASATESQGNG
jgi:lipopolysaccharide transport system ATP-binding protein